MPVKPHSAVEIWEKTDHSRAVLLFIFFSSPILLFSGFAKGIKLIYFKAFI